MRFEVHSLAPFSSISWTVRRPSCSSSSRAAVTRFLAFCEVAPAESRACARRSSTAIRRLRKLADRRLGLLARLPRLRRDAGLQPLEVGVPARGARPRPPQRRSPSRRRRLPPASARRRRASSSAAPSFSSTSSGACAEPRRGRLPPPGAVRRGDARSAVRRPARASCSRTDPAADLGKLVVDRGGVPCRASCFVCFHDSAKAHGCRCQRSARRGGGSASSGRCEGRRERGTRRPRWCRLEPRRSPRARAAQPWPGCRRARGRGSRAPGAVAAAATTR